MQKTIASLNNEFKKIRTGRANPSMLDDIKIDISGNFNNLSLLFREHPKPI